MVFTEVMFVPKLQKRLISIGQLTQRKAEVTFRERSVVLTVSGRRFVFGIRRGKLYEMNGVVASCCFASADDGDIVPTVVV